ncbi:hypothetical protein ACFE04_003138 [Oxalis oulophora]
MTNIEQSLIILGVCFISQHSAPITSGLEPVVHSRLPKVNERIEETHEDPFAPMMTEVWICRQSMLEKLSGTKQMTFHLQKAFISYNSPGLKLELCTIDIVGLLSVVTRIFRENSLAVTRPEATTKAGKDVNTFYVSDASGYPVNAKTIEFIRLLIGLKLLKVKGRAEELNQYWKLLPEGPYLVGYLKVKANGGQFGMVLGP